MTSKKERRFGRILFRAVLSLALFSFSQACGDGHNDASTDAGPGPDGTGLGPDRADLADGSSDPDSGGSYDCPAQQVGARLGRQRLMLGGAMEAATLAQAPFDLRYHYVAGNVPEDGPCASCATGCFVEGSSCANTAGCDWWGCWQYDQLPPGRFVADFMTETAARGAVPMITYYIWFSVAGYVEGEQEVANLDDGGLLSAYLADFRFLCRVMAEDPSTEAILHIEPDLWGYAHQVSSDPGSIPAAVSSAAAPECAGHPDTVAGLARCMLAIAGAEAPNVLLGFHASAWGAGHDALINTNPSFDLAGHADETGQFMLDLGAGDADLLVVEMSDRDAGYNDRWWDETNGSLPDFAQALSWAKTLGAKMNLATLWWQVPYGHMGLSNTCDEYEDNRVDYFFDHPAEFAAAGSLGIAFGAGADCMTTAESDGGHFVDRASDYYDGISPLLCGP